MYINITPLTEWTEDDEHNLQNSHPPADVPEGTWVFPLRSMNPVGLSTPGTNINITLPAAGTNTDFICRECTGSICTRPHNGVDIQNNWARTDLDTSRSNTPEGIVPGRNLIGGNPYNPQITPGASAVTNARGQEVMAVNDGEVITSLLNCAGGGDVASGMCSGAVGAAGHFIEIRHQIAGEYFVSRYFHLSHRYASADQRVRAGEVIGRMGNTGNTSGNSACGGANNPTTSTGDSCSSGHLHFEMRRGRTATSERMDPMQFHFVAPEDVWARSATPRQIPGTGNQRQIRTITCPRPASASLGDFVCPFEQNYSPDQPSCTTCPFTQLQEDIDNVGPTNFYSSPYVEQHDQFISYEPVVTQLPDIPLLTSHPPPKGIHKEHQYLSPIMSTDVLFLDCKKLADYQASFCCSRNYHFHHLY